jgi:starch synthase
VAHYSPEALDGKQECRRDLLRRFGLDPDSTAPVIGIVSRFAAQKGFDLIALAADHLAHEDLNMVVLGSGDKVYEELFRRLVRQYPKRFAAKIGYDNELAHCIEAGSDIFLMPSRYEPCGLGQLIALRYGSVPVVRSTGGLSDTVRNYNPRTGQGTGFAFEDYSADALTECVARATSLYREPKKWKLLMQSGMQQDFSWERSAKEYEKVYRKAMKKK